MKQTKTHTHDKMKTAKGRIGKLPGSSLADLFERDVVSLDADSTVFDAAEKMLENHIGNIVITELKNGKRIPVGILTDRDIVVCAIARRLEPETTSVAEIMTSDLVTATEDEDFAALVHLISDEGVSRLPIVDASGALTGVLTSKHLAQFFAQGLCQLSSLSRQQQSREENKH